MDPSNACRPFPSAHARNHLFIGGCQGDWVIAVAFSPDGSRILTGSRDKTAVLRDTRTGQALKTWKHGDSVTAVVFSLDGSLVLTGSHDKTAVLRSVEP